VAYVGLSSGHLAAVDLASGTVLERINVGGPIHDLGFEGDFLFVLTSSQLRAYRFADGALQSAGPAALAELTTSWSEDTTAQSFP
jgi:hypothetical protein